MRSVLVWLGTKLRQPYSKICIKSQLEISRTAMRSYGSHRGVVRLGNQRVITLCVNLEYRGVLGIQTICVNDGEERSKQPQD